MRNIDTANLILFEDLERTADGFCKVRFLPYSAVKSTYTGKWSEKPPR